jgi:hypothetical protein
LYSKALEVKPGTFRNLRVQSDFENDRLFMVLELPEQEVKKLK